MMDYKAEVRPCDCVEATRNMLRNMIIKEKNGDVREFIAQFDIKSLLTINI